MKKYAAVLVLISSALSSTSHAEELKFDFRATEWMPTAKGRFGAIDFDERATYGISASLGATLGKSRSFGPSRVGLRVEWAQFESSGTISDLSFRNIYFDWDGLRVGHDDLNLSFGASLRYAEIEAKTALGSQESADAIIPEIRVRGQWKILSQLMLEASAEQGFPLGSPGGQTASTLESALSWQIIPSMSLRGGYRVEWLELGDMGSGTNKKLADFRTGGPFLGLEVRF